MIIKKTYSDGTYAIFKLLDINFEFHTCWLKGYVTESNIDHIIPTKMWKFELSENGKFEVLKNDIF